VAAVRHERVWKLLGGVPLEELIEPRLESHYAAQIVQSVGSALLPAVPDFRHTSFEWVPQANALAGGLVASREPFRAGIRLTDLALALFDGSARPVDVFDLIGRTLADGFSWLKRAVTSRGGAADRIDERVNPDIPRHPVRDGARFTGGNQAARTELAAWYDDADQVLGAFRAGTPNAGPVRCWPHHFDIASLVVLSGDGGEGSRTVGVGLSPGDAGCAEPYWYVTPWPAPRSVALPPLPAGAFWHTEGWVGAVLTASVLVRERNAEQQATAVRVFLDAAFRECRRITTTG